MKPPLSAEVVYNHLTGEEVKQILCGRFLDILERIPELSQSHITLPRVRMELSVRLEIQGRTPPKVSTTDDLVVRMRDMPPATEISAVKQRDEEVVVSANDVDGGDPPDKIRDEHSLPVNVPTRTPFGIQDVPTVRPGATYPPVTLEGRTITIKMDKGPARKRFEEEHAPLPHEIKNSGATIVGGESYARGGPDVKLRETEFGQAQIAVNAHRRGEGGEV